MKEIYKVMNNTRGTLMFQVYPIQDADKLNAVASHHRRRTIRSAAKTVVLPHAQSVDLIEATGLTVADLKFNIDLNKLIHDKGHLQVLQIVRSGDVDKVEAADVISEAEVAAEATAEATAKLEVPSSALPPSFAVPAEAAKPLPAKPRKR